MKLYIASSFSHIPRVRRVTLALESAGHTITEKWWDRRYEVDGMDVHTADLHARDEDLNPEEFYSIPTVYQSFLSDLTGLKQADALLFVASDVPQKYNGAAVELGIAIGDCKPCYLLGELETSVLFAPLKRCKDIDQLLGEIDKYSRLMGLEPAHPAKEVIQ